MIIVIDVNESGLTPEQVLESVRNPEGAILRREGKVIGRIEPADEIDLEDEVWVHATEQVERGLAARRRSEAGESISHDKLKQQLENE